jgi:hypothetical protein
MQTPFPRRLQQYCSGFSSNLEMFDNAVFSQPGINIGAGNTRDDDHFQEPPGFFLKASRACRESRQAPTV